MKESVFSQISVHKNYSKQQNCTTAMNHHEKIRKNIKQQQHESSTLLDGGSSPNNTRPAADETMMLHIQKSILDNDDGDCDDSVDKKEEDQRKDSVDPRDESQIFIEGEEENYTTEWENVPSSAIPLNCAALCQIDDLKLTASACQVGAEQLELMSKCRHPMELLSIFHENQNEFHEQSIAAVAGFHFIPVSCEYCGAYSLSECSESCQRPKSFFRRKRPPFRKRSLHWHSITGDAITQTQCSDTREGIDDRRGDEYKEGKDRIEKQSPLRKLSGLFRG